MAPELFKTMEANELRELAQKIKDYQEAKKLTFALLLKKFRGIGSDKTFNRILAGDLSELDLEKQLNNYRAVWALIESLGDEEADEEEFYDDLFPVIQLKRAFFETTRENGNGRVIFLLGPTGSGKSCARKLLIEKYGERLLWIEASEAWGGSPMAFLGAILVALGKKDVPYGQVDRLNLVIQLLKASRRCLVIEEAHHLGPRNLNVQVTLVNQTPGEFVNLAIDTLWKKLESAAYEECRQLTGNRLAERINLGREPRESDVCKLLERRIKWADPDPKKASKQAAKLVLDKAANYGRLAFVRDVCKRANEMAESKPVDIELFAGAVTEEVASR